MDERVWAVMIRDYGRSLGLAEVPVILIRCSAYRQVDIFINLGIFGRGAGASCDHVIASLVYSS